MAFVFISRYSQSVAVVFSSSDLLVHIFSTDDHSSFSKSSVFRFPTFVCEFVAASRKSQKMYIFSANTNPLLQFAVWKWLQWFGFLMIVSHTTLVYGLDVNLAEL